MQGCSHFCTTETSMKHFQCSLNLWPLFLWQDRTEKKTGWDHHRLTSKYFPATSHLCLRKSRRIHWHLYLLTTTLIVAQACTDYHLQTGAQVEPHNSFIPLLVTVQTREQLHLGPSLSDTSCPPSPRKPLHSCAFYLPSQIRIPFLFSSFKLPLFSLIRSGWRKKKKIRLIPTWTEPPSSSLHPSGSKCAEMWVKSERGVAASEEGDGADSHCSRGEDVSRQRHVLKQKVWTPWVSQLFVAPTS